MNLRTFLFLAAAVPAVWGQEPAEVRIPESEAPAAVSQALRERVNGFYENHTGSVKRRAIDFVAEDTQDFYFSARKTVYKKFSVQKVEYLSKNFDRADVTVETTYDMAIEGNLLENTQASITTWKIEDGKWYWTRDVDDPTMNPASIFATVAAVAAVKPQSGDPNAKAPDLKNLNLTEMMAQQQRAILSQSKLDKDRVEFVAGTAGEQQVTLQNGFTGDVSLIVEGNPNVDGLTVTVDKTTLRPQENGVVRFKYAPSEAKAQSGSVRLVVQPFSQTFVIQVFAQPKEAPAK
jgi:hypothetical protein